jgi:LysR family glycine cleavage system transcriptional activator
MSLLCAFEAAARHESFTAAAAELNLTQSAVSRQIRSLEEMLRYDLFYRERQTVRLTIAGHAYARDVRDALNRVSAATLGFCTNPYGYSLNLAVLPTFGARWLVPKLPLFLAEHPDLRINLTTRLSPFDFSVDTVDAAIQFGAPEWVGAELEIFMDEWVVPVCSPTLKKTYGFKVAADLLSAPLLQLHSRPDAWERWFERQNVEWKDVYGMMMDQFYLMAKAAAAGMGVALLPQILIDDELERKELVVAVGGPTKSLGSYYLAWPLDRITYPPLVAFRTWLRNQVA